MADKIYLRTIPRQIRKLISENLIDVWFYDGNEAYFLSSHPNAREAIDLINSEKLRSAPMEEKK